MDTSTVSQVLSLSRYASHLKQETMIFALPVGEGVVESAATYFQRDQSEDA